MRPWLVGAWTVLVSGLLVTALGLRFAADRGAVDPGLHGMASVVAAVLAIGSHVRRGGGGDFLAVVLLLATIGLGTAGGAGSGLLHPALAIAATGLSVGLHLLRPVAAAPARAPEAPR
jgi:hypothetical protein